MNLRSFLRRISLHRVVFAFLRNNELNDTIKLNAVFSFHAFKIPSLFGKSKSSRNKSQQMLFLFICIVV